MKILSIICLCSLSLFAQMLGPKIYFPNDTFDFGTIKQGQIASHTFVIVNKGDDTLKIQSVITSCGCTAAELQKKEIFPNETVNLLVKFNSMGKVGEQSKYISVASNDKENPSARLLMRGKVLQEMYVEADTLPKIEFTETTFDFGPLKEGQIVDHLFAFKNAGKKDLEIKNIQTSCGCTAAVTSTKLLKPGESGSLKVEFDSTNKSGKLSRTITLTTNEPTSPMKTITIFAEVNKRDS